MSNGNNNKSTVLDKYRPLTDEELSLELTPNIFENSGTQSKSTIEKTNNYQESRELQEKNNLTDNIDTMEVAEEVAPMPSKVIPFRQRKSRQVEKAEDVNTHSGLAVTGVILSVLSLFFLPYVLATIAIILGYMAYKRGDDNVSMWAMGIGVASLVGTLIVSAVV